ncbi:hypothetical protein AOC05_08420 [Arthrobacter alpinus]|uniref:DUF2177 domain-containing protein n=1 Tax=Arthrobacter alpinus TaxID=656366 RepID=A0A0M4QYF0_9MICC|nr:MULTISPECIES: DUF2177 family protein [Arthrobacter]ALE92340.1 hypothetical protein AOC05_08420 [Arthrobacter alpinus]
MTSRSKSWLLHYVLAAVIFALIDVVWILSVALPQYQRNIPDLMAAKPQLAGAGFFYLIFVAGIVHYGVRPLELKAPLRQRVGAGALFGFFSYTTWAMTAFSILKDFPLSVAITDILWGTGASAVVVWLTLIVSTALRKNRKQEPLL